MSDVKVRIHTNALVEALEAAGLTVGRAKAPKDTDPPYVVIYGIPGGARYGSLDDPFEDADLVYQATCVGRSQQEAEWQADKVDSVLDAGLEVDGRSIHVIPHMTPGSARSDVPTPEAKSPLFYCTPRYRLMSTPS